MRLRNNTYHLRNLKENIDGKISGIYFYKYKTVNDAIKEYAQKFSNWSELYFKDIKLDDDKAKIFISDLNNAVSKNKKLVKEENYKKLK